MNMMNKNIYFLGIGGIGMSALARYFHKKGCAVAGYDKTPSPLTRKLEEEGIRIHYEDNPDLIPENVDLVIFTPAIPADSLELDYLKKKQVEIIKRAQVLGEISRQCKSVAVAGSHGKTTVTSLISYLLHYAQKPMSAFIGGIAKNINSNVIIGGENDEIVVMEADEFDRSFHQLTPYISIVTSIDADHLDIYGTYEAVVEAFGQFAALIKAGGDLVLKQGVDITLPEGIDIWRYSYDEPCDFYARRVRLLEGGYYRYDIVTPDGVVEDCTLGIPGWINIENSVAAVASLWCAARKRGEEFDAEALRQALAEYSGVKRRFEFYVNTPRQVYMEQGEGI